MPQTPPQPANASAVANQVLKTWWFWLVLAILVWSGLLLVDQVTHYQAKRYQAELAQTASNQLAESIVTISNTLRQEMTHVMANQLSAGFGSISNQIAAALQGPDIQAAIREAAVQQANLTMSKTITPAVAAFQYKLAQAQAKLDSVTNLQTSVSNMTPQPPAVAAKPSRPVVKPPVAGAKTNAPAGLVFDSESVVRQGAGYVVTVNFKKTGDQPLGFLRFLVGAFNQLPARILAIDANAGSATDFATTLDPTQLEGSVSFTPPTGVDPVIKILMSGPSVLQIVCDALAEPVTVRALTTSISSAPTTP